MSDIVIHNISQLITLAGPRRPRVGRELREIGMIENGMVVIRDGFIAAAGTSSTVEAQVGRAADLIDAKGGVVLPGFVDAHTHPVFAGTREDEYEMRAEGQTYQQIAARGGGIKSTVRKTRAATEEQLFLLALPRVNWLLEHGTTTVEAKSGYGLTLGDELKILRVIQRLNQETPLELVPTFLGAHEIPEEFKSSPEDYVQLILEEMLPRVVSEGLAVFADVFCESHVFNVAQSSRMLTKALSLGLGLRLHAEQLSHSGGAELAAKLGAVTADHLEWADEKDIRLLKQAGVTAVLLPGAVFNLGLTRYPAARMMIEAELPIALATDFNPGSSPTPSMQMILSIACTQMRMTPAEALTAATVNPAYTLGLGDQVGSIEPGKKADVVLLDCPDYRQIPYFYGMNHALTVLKSGRVVVDRRNLTEFNPMV